ncbi:hypothetical protein BC939DRAFT_496459 [Gamsiella multidivaricata]|uniref:uncharacterized protein n=1 Tax=Gamsiella multidivaricata TaxID=101098 RepID=UPI00221F1B58|nr:uncharacterized protein BC939DRAFT_496459 [Gamsiella multidivaricata]KAI7817724.1 hypothetical protein BC939DRAFT_496459 [Gamsiella multidivaricata]
MHPTSHTSFVPDLDMNPPPAWSKPASALGLDNPLSHLPQSQQLRHLQEQIQHHQRLQQQQSHGYGIGGKKKNSQNGSSPTHSTGGNNNNNSNNNNSSNNSSSTSNNRDRTGAFQQQSFGSGGGHQHINIKNSDDMDSDEDIDEDIDLDEDDGNRSDGRNSQSDMQGLNPHRSLSHPQLTQGFAIPSGFTGLTPSSPLSPSSPGSITSEPSSMTASMLSPGLLSSGSGYPHHNHHSHNHGGNTGNSIHGIESSLASLASLSVMPTSSPSSSSSTMPMSMPPGSRGRTALSPSHYSSQMASTPTTSSFQPQSLPMIYHNQSSGLITHHGGDGGGFMPTSVAGQAPSFSAFSSALTQHIQRQQQQMTSAAMSSSLPAHSSFNSLQQQQNQHAQQQQQNQYHHYHHHHHQQQQQQQEEDQQDQQDQQQRSRSKSLTIPAPRIVPPARVLPPRPPQTSAPRKYHGRQTRKLASTLPTPKEPVDPTRRVAHIISEQKRREKINGGFDELKSVIPECAQNTDSKATILRKAVDYILSLEDELRKYVDLYQLEAGSNPESSLEDHERER